MSQMIQAVAVIDLGDCQDSSGLHSGPRFAARSLQGNRSLVVWFVVWASLR